MNRKGFYPLFTTLGLVLVIMVLATAIQWNASGTKSYTSHIDRLSWLRINHAITNMRSIASASLRDILYDAVMQVGKIEAGSTMNKYLNYTKEEGWALMVSDIKSKVSDKFTDVLPELADYSDGHQSTFVFDGINISIGEITAENIDVIETGDGIAAVVQLPLMIADRYNGWEATIFESNVTIPLNVRLKDMHEMAWNFHKNYEETVRWAFTGAIYARAYWAAYMEKDGVFLKEGHYDFDPVATLLFGDLDTAEEFARDPSSVLDLGAIPAATWFVEWQQLSEPGFLPAGFDMTGGDAEQAQEAIANSFKMGELEEAVCDDPALSPEQRKECEYLYDPEKLEEEVDRLGDEKERYEDLLIGIGKWLYKYDTAKYENCKSCSEEYDICRDKCRSKPKNKRQKCYDNCDEDYDECTERYVDKNEKCKRYNPLDGISCDDFRDSAEKLIIPIVETLEGIDETACRETIQRAESENDISGVEAPEEAKDAFYENNESYGFDQVDCSAPVDAIADLQDILKNNLKETDIADRFCVNSRAKGDCIYQSVCEDGGDCGVSCRYPNCPSGGESYECWGDKKIGYRTETCENCYTTSSGQTRCRTETDRIDQCTCRCRASIDLLMRINANLEQVELYVEKTYKALKETYENLDKQLENRKKMDELAEAADKLNAKRLNYDVFSRIRPIVVGYDKGELSGGKLCYYNTTFKDRDKGVCGDSVESVTVYTIQVAAAALATVFSAGATEELLRYAISSFPMIYESRAEYELTETLIDDGNRIILTNLASDGGEMYTYAPFQFEIYKDRRFSINSATLGRTIVYVYMPKVSGGLQRVMDGLLDESCTGESC